MKIFRFVTAVAIMLSGYIGYENFVEVNFNNLLDQSISESKVSKSEAAKKSSEEKDYVDIGIKILETVGPLLAPVLIRKRRKTLDEELGDVAIAMGISRKTIKSKLGLGDQRKQQTGTRKRRKTD
jgi:NTP pyrophosphatase (non-canonical NTP hydrolase)